MTPGRGLWLWVLLAALVLSGPLFDLGEYPYLPETGYLYVPLGLDALTVRPLEWLLLWVVLSTPLALVTWLALRAYPGSISLFSSNRVKPYWTLGVSGVCALAVVPVLGEAFEGDHSRFWTGVRLLRALLSIYWLLSIRALLVHRTVLSGDTAGRAA